MVVGIGCDIVEHKITSKLGWDKKPHLLERIFSLKELEQINKAQTIRYISGRFAAKEAVLKSLGTVMEDGISLKDIQILQMKNGKPIVKLGGRIKVIAKNLKIVSIQVSLSHTTDYSMAFAISEKLK